MENSLENKAKFFAQYWGQGVLTDGIQTHAISPSLNLKHESFYLKLIHLALITDEDSRIVADLNGYRTEIYKEFDLYFSHTDSESLDCCFFSSSSDVYEPIESADIDYLRSKGYAVPYMGVSVADLIEYGWIKIS